MAQVVGYFQNNVSFSDGPFVIVNISGWRIEVEVKGNEAPALPHVSLYSLVDMPGLQFKTKFQEQAAATCDRLNEMAKAGQIILNGNQWVLRP